MALNDERLVILSFSPSCPSVSYHDWHLTFGLALRFFSIDRLGCQQLSALWHQDMTDMHLDQGIGSKNYEKLEKTLVIFFFGAHPFSIVESVDFALLNITTWWTTPLWSLPLILLVPLTRPPHLQSLAHYTRLVNPWQVLHCLLVNKNLLCTISIVLNRLQSSWKVWHVSSLDRLQRARRVWKDRALNNVGGRLLNFIWLFFFQALFDFQLSWVALFLETERNSSSSNSTYNKRECISIETYQTWNKSVLNGLVNTTFSPKQRLIPVVQKLTKYPWKHNISVIIR
jgi:hypothetical protein